MKGMSLGILLAIVLSLMCILFGAGYTDSNGATCVAAHFEGRMEVAVLSREFKIKYGQELRVKGQNLKVKFASVLDDSRCATGATCVWAGDAKILISMREGNAEESRMGLHINGTQSRKYQQYVIRLVALDPYPRTDVEIKPSDYVATLLIKKE
jgi:hypothetical protein